VDARINKAEMGNSRTRVGQRDGKVASESVRIASAQGFARPSLAMLEIKRAWFGASTVPWGE
jgi:hypothetical protein